ncbi:MAG: MotA/TolQ/ExbB proton channel family protein [Lachnospiraceae bacterium]|nr:MotA/TolQ/ExbB proton channel family protein [Lachnospiraceae bacterium]
MNKKGYEALIVITYIAMGVVCVCLNLFGKNIALPNIIINGAMFVIVGLVFIVSITGSLTPIAGITADLINVSEKIEEDAKHSHRFLWEKYREDKEELFRDRILRERYKDFCYELDRVVHNDRSYYKCDIEDYIGLDLIDSIIHRESLNQVAGAMTGLGILGTFLGLTLGLQNFNTGTTAEITNSIEPLMEGIKVAFHTSIYGMVFSLVFNYVYKRRLDEAETAVRDFLSTYKKFVMPDTAAEGVNKLIELTEKQTKAILQLENIANIRSRDQMEELGRIVDRFMEEMDRSLGGTFTKLSDTIDRTLLIQGENEKKVKEILTDNTETAGELKDIASSVKDLQLSLKSYTVEVQDLSKSVVLEIESLKKQSEKTARISEALPSEVDETFRIINDNLRQVETHFRDRIEEINATLEELGRVIRHLDETNRKTGR